ncbi:MAG: glycosyltransferase family 4 protein, partial [Phycisphaeraceae bacterium]|nr:glycosyltransferase family 4 protein [Phycisphaeraceae bacterium]
ALKVIVSGGDPASGGPTRAAPEGRAAELGLAVAPRFTGVVDDPAAYLAAMDIQVMPSRREGLGLVAGEGMLAGCAVIGSAVDGIPEIVIDGVTGLLVPPENPEALAEAIDRLIANPDLRRRLAAKGEERVRDIHSPLRFDSDLLAVVEQLLASR